MPEINKYDADGNALSTDCRAMVWNSENQLSTTTNSGGCGTQVVTNEYDGDGSRVLRTNSNRHRSLTITNGSSFTPATNRYPALVSRKGWVCTQLENPRPSAMTLG